MKGAMLWFNETENTGVIVAENGEQLPVDGTAFTGGEAPKGRCGGIEVTFDVAEVAGSRAAVHVEMTPAAAPRRARLRRGGYR